MSVLNEIISKNIGFVILCASLAIVLPGCNLVPSQSRPESRSDRRTLAGEYSSAEIIGRIKSGKIKESSGVANSRCSPDLLWTHNDSGNDNTVFALNIAGEVVSRWRVTGTTNIDWEDMASFRDKSGRCFLYFGDIGNNGLLRSELQIYKVPEPERAGVKNPKIQSTPKAQVLKFSYPDGRHNAETLIVHPVTEAVYVVTKSKVGAAAVYEIAGTGVAKKIADISVPSLPEGFFTSGDIDPTGRRVIIADYFGGYEYVLPDGINNFDEIWRQKPGLVDLGIRDQGEAVSYSADGLSIYATSENSNSPIIKSRRSE